MPKKILSSDEVQTLLQEYPEWSLEAGTLVRTWTFPTFPEAIAFVNHAATLAELADHHPDIDIRYTRVRLALISHDAAGLTARDAAMVRRLQTLSPSSTL